MVVADTAAVVVVVDRVAAVAAVTNGTELSDLSTLKATDEETIRGSGKVFLPHRVDRLKDVPDRSRSATGIRDDALDASCAGAGQ